MQLSRTRVPVSTHAGSHISHPSRWMVRLVILTGVFIMAFTAIQEWNQGVIMSVSAASTSGNRTSTYRQWGVEALSQIQSSFWLPTTRLYAEQAQQGQDPPEETAFFWSRVVHLSALIEAARVDPSFIPGVRQDVASLRAYWVEADGLGGFDVLPPPKPLDRYYDDNAWMTLALLDGYEVTHDVSYLEWAMNTFRFVQSGEDKKQGGIYWRESLRETRNACSTAPAALAALRLYQLTHDASYLQMAQRLYDWMGAHLRDRDSLYFDNISTNGQIDRTKWSYNSALMIELNTRFHVVTGRREYLDRARQIAHAAEQRWVDANGAIADDAPFAQHLSEAFLGLYEETGEVHWRQLVERAVVFLHDKAADPEGHYGRQWAATPTQPLQDYRLIDMASAAHAYWLLAR